MKIMKEINKKEEKRKVNSVVGAFEGQGATIRYQQILSYSIQVIYDIVYCKTKYTPKIIYGRPLYNNIFCTENHTPLFCCFLRYKMACSQTYKKEHKCFLQV